MMCFRCDFSREWCWWRVLLVGLCLQAIRNDMVVQLKILNMWVCIDIRIVLVHLLGNVKTLVGYMIVMICWCASSGSVMLCIYGWFSIVVVLLVCCCYISALYFICWHESVFMCGSSTEESFLIHPLFKIQSITKTA